MLSEPPRQPKGKKGSSQYHKGHDGSISTCAFFNPRWKVPNGYIAVAWLLFLQEQIKFIIIYTISYHTFGMKFSTVFFLMVWFLGRYSGKLKGKKIGWQHQKIWVRWNLVQVLHPLVLTRRGGRAMTRQWRKKRQSDLAKPDFSFDQWWNSTPDFSYTWPNCSAHVWSIHDFF